MSSNKLLCTVATLLLTASSLIILASTAEGDQIGPVISDVTWTPETPYWDEGVNISANVTDPDGLSYVNLQWCIGDMCYPPVPMNHGNGDQYWYFAQGPFPNGTVTFDILTEDTAGNPSYYKFNVTFRPRPTDLHISVSVQPDTLYPGGAFTISGNLTLNTGEPPANGSVKVYLEGEEVGSAGTDEWGGFNISLQAPRRVGNYTYQVIGEGDGFRAEDNVSIRVIEKPLPDLVLTLHFTGVSRDESGIYLFPTDTFRGRVEVENTGTAPAGNFTLIISRDGEEVTNETLNFSLAPSEVWSRNFTLPAGEVGEHTVYASVQGGGEEIDVNNNNDTLTYHVIKPPAHPTQKVLVELFTSKTCEPCISSEHALDYLRYIRGENATIVAYVDDDPSAPSLQEITSAYGITGTPTVVFDGGYRVKVGGGSESELIETYQRYLNESLTRFRPDVSVSINSVLMDSYRVYGLNISVKTGELDETLTGLSITLYGITPYLGPRGFNGVPIRYTISHFTSMAVPDLEADAVYNVTLTPNWEVGVDGIVLVAALRQGGDEVLSHDRYEMTKKPLFYVGPAPREVKVPKHSSEEVVLNVEYFRYGWEEDILPIRVNVDVEMISGGGFTLQAPEEVYIDSSTLVGEEWDGRLEKYSAEVRVVVTAGEHPSDAGLLLVTFSTSSPSNWSVDEEVRVSLTVPRVVLISSYVERRGDYMVIKANFTNTSSSYVVQIEYVFYNGAVEQATSFSYLTFSGSGSYRGEIQIPGEYKRMKYRLYVRESGEILYKSDWIDVRVPPSGGAGGGEEGSIVPYVASTVIGVIIILGAYLFVMRRKRSLRRGIEE